MSLACPSTRLVHLKLFLTPSLPPKQPPQPQRPAPAPSPPPPPRSACRGVSGRVVACRARPHLAVDDGREAEVVEDLGAVAPHGDGAVLAQALVVEAVHLRDLPALVVAPDQGDAVGVANLGGRGGAGGPWGSPDPHSPFLDAWVPAVGQPRPLRSRYGAAWTSGVPLWGSPDPHSPFLDAWVPAVGQPRPLRSRYGAAWTSLGSRYGAAPTPTALSWTPGVTLWGNPDPQVHPATPGSHLWGSLET